MKIEINGILSEIRIPFWSVLVIVFKISLASVIISAMASGLFLLLMSLLVVISPTIGM